MDVQQETARITQALAARHPLFAPATVERLVTRVFAEFEGAAVTTYLPILVSRAADVRLRDLDHDYPAEPAAERRVDLSTGRLLSA